MGQNFSSEPVVEKETERDHNDTFNVAVSSCQGWRMSQEDNHSLILDLPGDHKAAFFAVYDGHGSARVSKHASESLWRHLVENESYIKGSFREALEKAFLTFDHEVNESYNAQLAGTTAVSLLIVDNVIYCANIGDSRGVACVNCECVPLSYDHKPDNPSELKRILAAGGYVLGNRVNGNLALSRAFGDFHYKSNDQLPPEQQIVSPCPDINILDLNDDVDFLVLACDGIWDVLSSEEVVEFVIARLEQSMEPGLICEQLTTRCLATDYELVIGCDNMTVLLICYTRGRSWSDFCTDIFNKNTRRLGVPRTRPSSESGSGNVEMIDQSSSSSKVGNPTTNEASDSVEKLNRGDYYNILSNVLSSTLTVGNSSNNTMEESSSSASANERTNNDEELLAMTTTKTATSTNLEEEDETSVLCVEKGEPELEQANTITELAEGDKSEKNSNDELQEQQDGEKQQECQLTRAVDDEQESAPKDDDDVVDEHQSATCQPDDERNSGSSDLKTETETETNNDGEDVCLVEQQPVEQEALGSDNSIGVEEEQTEDTSQGGNDDNDEG